MQHGAPWPRDTRHDAPKLSTTGLQYSTHHQLGELPDQLVLTLASRSSLATSQASRSAKLSRPRFSKFMQTVL